MAVDRQKLKEQLMKRSQESYATKDKGDKFGTIFKPVPGLQFWKCGEGEHTIDILTWRVGSQYPKTEEYQHVKEGDFAYLLDLWVHREVGLGEHTRPCLLKNWGERCPICEDLTRISLSEEPDDDLIGKKKAKRRSIYYIVCYDSASQEEKGVQIWDVYHGYMEKIISSRAKLPKGGGTVLFALPDQDGKQVYFKREGMGATSTDFIDHTFLDRDYTYPDEVWMELTPLDELIEKPSYESLYEEHFGIPYKGDEEKAEPVRVVKPAPTSRVRQPLKQTANKPAEEPAPETKSKVTRTAVKRAPLKEQEVGEYSSGSSAKTSKVSEGTSSSDETCPGGGIFGVSINEPLDYCDTCEKWDDCAAEANRLESVK